MIRKPCFLIAILLLLSNPLSASTQEIIQALNKAHQPIGVTLIAFDVGEHNFWRSVSEFMRAAAEDLNMDLEIINAQGDAYQMKRQAQEVIQRKQPPDYLVVANVKNVADEIIQAAEKNKVKVFLMNTGFNKRQRSQMGKPREKYAHWIGKLIPDDLFGGYLSAKVLIEHALEAEPALTDDGALQLVAISGDRTTQASKDRLKGLRHAVSQYPNVVLKQKVHGQWSHYKAWRYTELLLEDHPQIGAIWAANDAMALGALKAVKQTSKTPGKDIFITGIDWTPEAIEAVQSGDLVATIGGHFMDGAWVMVLLHDYHKGHDFTRTPISHQMMALDADNIDDYLSKLDEHNWDEINFRKFSKVYNPYLSEYTFSPEYLLK